MYRSCPVAPVRIGYLICFGQTWVRLHRSTTSRRTVAEDRGCDHRQLAEAPEYQRDIQWWGLAVPGFVRYACHVGIGAVGAPGTVKGTNVPKREKHIVAEVDSIPPCDICTALGGAVMDAAYDGKTMYGPWGFMCEEHFASHGIGVGLGKGQHLKLREKNQ